MKATKIYVSLIPLLLAVLGICAVFSEKIVSKYYVFPSIIMWCIGLLVGIVCTLLAKTKLEKTLAILGTLVNFTIVALVLAFVSSAARA